MRLLATVARLKGETDATARGDGESPTDKDARDDDDMEVLTRSRSSETLLRLDEGNLMNVSVEALGEKFCPPTSPLGVEEEDPGVEEDGGLVQGEEERTDETSSMEWRNDVGLIDLP
jgi:hypothetical protein